MTNYIGHSFTHSQRKNPLVCGGDIQWLEMVLDTDYNRGLTVEQWMRRYLDWIRNEHAGTAYFDAAGSRPKRADERPELSEHR